MSGANALLRENNILLILNSTLNLTDNVSKSKREIKKAFDEATMPI